MGLVLGALLAGLGAAQSFSHRLVSDRVNGEHENLASEIAPVEFGPLLVYLSSPEHRLQVLEHELRLGPAVETLQSLPAEPHVDLAQRAVVDRHRQVRFAVVVGVGGTLLGMPYLDGVAAVVLDVGLSEPGVVDVLHGIAERRPEVRVIAVSAEPDHEIVLQADNLYRYTPYRLQFGKGKDWRLTPAAAIAAWGAKRSAANMATVR